MHQPYVVNAMLLVGGDDVVVKVMGDAWVIDRWVKIYENPKKYGLFRTIHMTRFFLALSPENENFNNHNHVDYLNFFTYMRPINNWQ